MGNLRIYQVLQISRVRQLTLQEHDMHKLILTILLIPALAVAAPVTANKSVVCDQAGELILYLMQKHGEMPVWLGSKEKSTATILANPKTQSWTIIHFQSHEDIACVLETGTGFKFMFPNPV